jgi:hypothetical protein
MISNPPWEFLQVVSAAAENCPGTMFCATRDRQGAAPVRFSVGMMRPFAYAECGMGATGERW